MNILGLISLTAHISGQLIKTAHNNKKNMIQQRC